MSELNMLTTIGTNSIKTTYKLNGKLSQGSSSASALIQVLDEKPRKIYLLVTEKTAGEPCRIFKEEVGDVDVQELSIPNGANADEIQTILQTILESIPDDSRLVMDITGGLRHFPFLFFISALYVRSFKNVQIEGIYYGMFEEKDHDGNCRHLDLKVLLEMADWFHSVSEFTDNRSALSLALMLRSASDREKELENYHQSSAIKDLSRHILDFDRNYGAGLPRGIGESSSKFITTYQKKKELIDKIGYLSIPLGAELFNYLNTSIVDLTLDNEFILTRDEINRQARIIDSYFKNNRYVNAIRLFREFIVTRCLFGTDRKKWLERKNRLRTEHRLSYFSNLDPQERTELGTIWNEIGQARNHIAHCGMNTDNIDLQRSMKRMIDRWGQVRQNLDRDEYWDLAVERGGGKLLITPLGLSKGLLYTAIKTTEPDYLIVFTSATASRDIDEILAEAGYLGERSIIAVEDPHTGFDEIHGKVLKMSREFNSRFRRADEIVINLTGGTTTLQYAVEILHQSMHLLNDNVKKVAMIDERDPSEQRSHPYVQGKMVELKGYLTIKEEFEESDVDGND